MPTGIKSKSKSACKECSFLDVKTRLENKQADLVFVTPQKVQEHIEQNVVLQVLNTIKTDKRFNTPDIWITPMWKCPPESKLTRTKLKKCFPVLKNELELLKPKYVISFGLDVTNVLLKSGSFTVLAPIYSPEYDTVIIPMLGIDAYTDNRNLLSDHLKELKTSLSMDVSKSLDTQILMDTDHIKEFLRFLRTRDAVGFDIETNSLDPFDKESKILTIAFGVDNTGIAFPLHLKYQGNELCYTEIVRRNLEVFFSQETPILVGHNLMFDIKFVEQVLGFPVKNKFLDTMILAYINNEDTPSLKLEALLPTIGLPNHKTYDFSPENYKAGDLHTSTEVANLLTYNAKDAISTLLLSQHLLPQVPQVSNPLLLLLHNTARTLMDIDSNGMPVDIETAKVVYKELTDEMKVLENKLMSIPAVRAVTEANELDMINLRSPQQIATVLTELGAPVISTTATGAISTNAANLEILAEQYDVEFAQLVLDYRAKSTLVTTYLDPLLSEENDLLKADGKVHPSFGLTTTRTGRLSCSRPNLQNIPRDKTIKQIFIPNPGQLMVNFDYSQAELRVLAMLSKDPTLIKAYKEGQDIHRITAASVYDVPLPEVTDDQRQAAKTINFAILYGVSAFGLSKNLKITEKEAKKIIKRWFETFPGAQRFTSKITSIVESTRQIANPFGRIRHVPAIKSSNPKEKAHAIRQAVNFPTQSTASDLLLLSLVKIQKLLKEGNYRSSILTTVHDSISVSIAQDEADFLVPKIVEILEVHDFPWMQGVRMEAEVSIGTTLATDSVIAREDYGKISQHEYWKRIEAA